MIWAVFVASVVIVLVLALRPPPGRGALAVTAVPPVVAAFVSTAWLVTEVAGTASVPWVDGLGLELAFRIDSLTTGLGLIVSAIGVGVFVDANGYFSAGSPGLFRFAATLLVFSGSMLGLVWGRRGRCGLRWRRSRS